MKKKSSSQQQQQAMRSSSPSPSHTPTTIKIIFKPHQAFETTFEYSFHYLTLQIVEFTSPLSPIFLAGGKIGMILLSMNQIQFQGLSQDDILFILTSKKNLLREIILSEPKKMIENGRNLPKLSSKISSPPSSSSTPSLSSSSSSSSGGQSTSNKDSVSQSQSKSLPTPSFSQNSFALANSSSQSSTSSHYQTSYPRQSAAPSSGDPFSTPARRRRLVADIARFLLKQYYIKACEHVAYQRFYLKCIILVQCWIRQYLAKKRLQELRYRHHTKNCLVIQRYYRCLIARDQLNERIKLRYNLKYYAMVLRVQTKYRQYQRTRRYQRMIKASKCIQHIVRGYLARKLLQRMKQEKFRQNQLEMKSVEKIQCRFRQYLARLRYWELYSQYCLKRVMKYRILQHWRGYYHQKRFIACLRIQSQIRVYLSKKISSQRKAIKLKKEKENSLMLREDLMSRYVHDHTIEISLNLPIKCDLMTILRGLPICSFIHWCIQHRILLYSEHTDRYGLGQLTRNLLNLWYQSHHSSLDRIEVPNSSIQSDSTPDEILFPDDLQCPSNWGKRYPTVLSSRNQLAFRSSQNRWGQIVINFENIASWKDFMGKDSVVRSSEDKVYHLNVRFGERTHEQEISPLPVSTIDSKLTDIPNLDVRDLEIMISLTTTSHTSEGTSKQVVCRIESDTQSESPLDAPLKVSSEILAEESSLLDLAAAGGVVELDQDFIHDDNDDDHDYESHPTGRDTGDMELASHEEAERVPVSQNAIKPNSISRPTTATTRLYITREVALTEEQILENQRQEWRIQMKNALSEMVLRVASLTLQKAHIASNQLRTRIMIVRIQRGYRAHRLYLIHKAAAQRIQQVYRRGKSLKLFQRTVYLVIERFNLVVKFLQQKGRLIHAKGVVKQRREEFCENSRERRQPLVSLITERLLSPYSWLDSSTLENAENEVTLRRIANTFQIESNPISEVLPSPPSSSIPVPQYSFLPYSPPPSHNGSDSTFCRERPFVHSSHWAQELFQLLDLPKSTFGSQVDLTNSQYLLIKSNASDNESQKYTSSHERLDLDSVILSHSDPWNQSYTTPDMLPRYGGFGDIHTSTDGHRINLQKYTQLSNVGAAIPPVFQVIKEKYSL